MAESIFLLDNFLKKASLFNISILREQIGLARFQATNPPFLTFPLRQLEVYIPYPANNSQHE